MFKKQTEPSSCRQQRKALQQLYAETGPQTLRIMKTEHKKRTRPVTLVFIKKYTNSLSAMAETPLKMQESKKPIRLFCYVNPALF
jgi:hypothetical protein